MFISPGRNVRVDFAYITGVTASTENFKITKDFRPNLEFVGSKAKGRMSKRVFQENKARQIF